MANNKNKTEISQGKLITIASLITGIIMSAVYLLLTGVENFISSFIVLLTAMLTALVTKWCGNHVITRTANRLTIDLEVIKQGDYSKFVESKSFGILAKIASIINAVLSDIRTLIEGFFTLSLSIVQASRKVGATSKEASYAISEISKTVDEIAKGASEQAQEAQQGVQLVEKLSDQINLVYQSYSDVMQETNNIQSLNDIGLKSVNILRGKSEENFDSAEKIFSVVEKLTNSTKDIGMFVQSIEDIAEQTNMLSLNAAIEAARAGEAGKGFAVVAEEVRKLADQSRQATEEITSLMEGISEDSQLAIEAMDIMKKVSTEQNIAVDSTNKSFGDIADGIVSIVNKITKINDAVSKMQSDKDDVIVAIENISSVSQETAASSEQVAATTEQQLKAIDEMQVASARLDELVQELDKKLKKYKLR